MIVSQLTSARAAFNQLTRLYAAQLNAGGTKYLVDHARPEVVMHQVNVFEWYARHIRPGMRVLDWGCNHGPDACLMRQRFGDALDIQTCDFNASGTFPVFNAAARANYAQLTDPLTLPYPSETFDAVVGSGVLEHTAMDGEALKELYRVLRSHGLLVLAYLPYAYSWAEYLRRKRARDFHRRLYSRSGLSALLKSHGFFPLETQFQTLVPNVVAGKQPKWWKRLLRPLRYPLVSHSVLCSVAQKMTVM